MDNQGYNNHLLDDAYWIAVDALNQLQAKYSDAAKSGLTRTPISDEMSAKSIRIVDTLMAELRGGK